MDRQKMIKPCLVSHFRLLCIAVAACLLASLFLGCGKKGPPIPLEEQDLFSFSGARGFSAGGCLSIEGDLAGATHRFSRLFIEFSESDCTTCHFIPVRRLELRNPLRVQRYDVLVLSATTCDFRQDRIFSWRLIAFNALRTYPEVRSKIVLISPRPSGIPRDDR